MYAINRITKARVEVDPSNDDNIYYQLDKRLYDFIEDSPVELGEILVLKENKNGPAFNLVITIQRLEDLNHFFINENGNFVVKEPQND